MRIASGERAGKQIIDVGFRNPNGNVVLYTLNAGTAAQTLRFDFRVKTVATITPWGSVATFVWKP